MAFTKDFSVEEVARRLNKRKKYKDVLYFGKKCLSNPSFLRNVKQLCEFAGLDVTALMKNSLLKRIWHRPVLSISAVEPHFTKHSICCAMYDDNDDDVRWAYKNGAIAIVTDHQVDNLPCIVVDNPQRVYGKMCSYYRNLRKAECVAVTGSIGKTTVKRMVNCVLKEEYNTFCNLTNRNILYNVGFFSQHIPANTEIMVQEVSEDTPGYVEHMSQAICPKISIITCMDQSHIEAFGTKEAIVDECCSIVKYMRDDGIVIVNKDEFTSFEKLQGKQTITISMSDHSADYYAEDVRIVNDGLVFNICSKKGRYPIKLHYIYAIHNVTCALYAFAAARVMNEAPEHIIKGLDNFRMCGVRQNIMKAKDGTLVYADCYNAVPKSIETAVLALKEVPEVKKCIAVVGDIAETGSFVVQVHDKIATIIDNAPWVNVAVGIGENTVTAFQKHIFKKGMDIEVCLNTEDAIEKIRKHITKDCIILFKASHSMEFDLLICKIWPDLRKEMYREWDEEKKWLADVEIS